MSSSPCCSQFLRGRPGGRFQSAAGLREECRCGLLLTVAVPAKQVCSPLGDRCVQQRCAARNVDDNVYCQSKRKRHFVERRVHELILFEVGCRARAIIQEAQLSQRNRATLCVVVGRVEVLISMPLRLSLCPVPFLRYSASKNRVTLRLAVGVVQGH